MSCVARSDRSDASPVEGKGTGLYIYRVPRDERRRSLAGGLRHAEPRGRVIGTIEKGVVLVLIAALGDIRRACQADPGAQRIQDS